MLDTSDGCNSFCSHDAIGINVEAATAPTSSTESKRPANMLFMIIGRNLGSKSCLKIKMIYCNILEKLLL